MGVKRPKEAKVPLSSLAASRRHHKDLRLARDHGHDGRVQADLNRDGFHFGLLAKSTVIEAAMAFPAG